MDTSLETDVVNGLFGVYDRAIQFNVNKFTKESIIRSYYAEVEKNLALLSLLDIPDDKATLNKSQDFLPSIIKNLDITMACMILYNGKGLAWKTVYNKLKKTKIELKEDSNTIKEKDISEENDTKEDEQNQKEDSSNIKYLFDYMMFTIRKITILQQISSSPELNIVIPNLKIRKRLSNIKENLLVIKKSLKSVIKN